MTCISTTYYRMALTTDVKCMYRVHFYR